MISFKRNTGLSLTAIVVVFLLCASLIPVGQLFADGEVAQVSIGGMVLEESSSEPIENAHVLLEPFSLLTTTDVNGKFAFKTLPQGKYRLKVTHISYKPETSNIHIREGFQEHLVLHLEQKTYESEEITYSPKENRLSDQTTITHDELRNSPWKDVGEVLESVPGAQVYAEGGPGGKKTVSLHGCRPDQVVILYDGVPLNSGNGDAIDLATLSLNSIQKIEVLPQGSLEGGPGAIGGIVRITSAQAATLASGISDLHLEASEWGGRALQLETYLECGKNQTGYTVSYSYLVDQGDFTYRDESGAIKHRLNNSTNRQSVFLSVARPLNSTWSSKFSGSYYEAGNGAATPLFQPPTPDAEHTTRNFRLNGNFQRFENKHQSEIQFYGMGSERNYISPFRQYHPEIGWVEGFVPQDINDESIKTGISLRHRISDMKIRDFHFTTTLQSGGNLEQYESVNRNGYGSLTSQLDGKVYRTQLYGLLGSEIKKQLNAIQFAAGGSYRLDGITDSHQRFKVADTPKPSSSLRLAVSPTATKTSLRWDLAASYNRNYSPPPFFSTFLMENVFARGNPNLLPEESESIAITGRIASATLPGDPVLSLQGFRRTTWNLIYWRRNSRGQYFPDNLGEAFARGLEASISLGNHENLFRSSAHFTWQQVTDHDEDSWYYMNRVPFQPEYYGSLSLIAQPAYVAIGSEVHFSGRRYTTLSNLDPYNYAGGGLDPYWVLDLWARKNVDFLKLGWEMQFGVDNVLNTDYELLDNMPMPGRIWKISLRVAIH
ncbi:TonB-dependent receptor [bacterium]|nr:TonB-dependent receptor [bacterium]